MTRAQATAAAAIAAAALAARIAYVAAQPGSDPTFARPTLDEAVYVAWAQDLAAGLGEPPGAFYLAPLYPHLLAGWMLATGGSFPLLYVAQHALAVAAALALAFTAWTLAGRGAGLATGILALTYQPLLFFASRPAGETLAVALLALSLALGATQGPGAASGAALGMAALARPNLGLLAPLWCGGLLSAGRGRRALALAGAAAAVVLPATVWNWAASGHLVPVSANGGITFHHGNGPGALGIFTPPVGLSGRIAEQQEEATALASRAVGRALDPVEADAWWGREALAVRRADPPGTLRLLGRRLLLLLSTREVGLDAAPALDENPWRRAAPVPFAALLALSAAALAGAGFARTGGWLVWGAVLGCAATPLVFYVSSRYRLPLAAVLAVPAGIGVVRLLWPGKDFRTARAVGAACLVGAVSLLAPAAGLARHAEAAGLANRAAAWLQAGDVNRAAHDAQRALALDDDAPNAWFNWGVIAERRGDGAAAQQAYRRALTEEPAFADAAGNLGGLLIREGRTAEAIGVLEQGIGADSQHAVCWANLVLALAAEGRWEMARAAAARAELAGVRLDGRLLELLAKGGRP